MTQRIVADTNILVSGLLWSGPSRRLVDVLEEGRLQLLTTPDLTRELISVLSRPKFDATFAKAGITVADALNKHAHLAETVEPAVVPEGVIRDRKDMPVLAAAVGGKADYVISGDKDLLVLGEYEGIPIVTVSKFLEAIENE